MGMVVVDILLQNPGSFFDGGLMKVFVENTISVLVSISGENPG